MYLLDCVYARLSTVLSVSLCICSSKSGYYITLDSINGHINNLICENYFPCDLIVYIKLACCECYFLYILLAMTLAL